MSYYANIAPPSAIINVDSAPAVMVCDFLERNQLGPDTNVLDHNCTSGHCTSEHCSTDSGEGELMISSVNQASSPMVLKLPFAQQRRVQWSLETENPVLGLGYHLSLSDVRRGFCRGSSCECVVPYRGPLCDVEDSGTEAARSKPFRGAIHFIVNDEPDHIAELSQALRNTWSQFNEGYDYPILIFHDGLSSQTRARLLNLTPNRIWFHHVPDDFFPSKDQLPVEIAATPEGYVGASFSHHSFSIGYRAQCRFRAGPIFGHPAVTGIDYLWGLDTDSHFPEKLRDDPFEVMHSNESRVIGYRYLAVTTQRSSSHLWEFTHLYFERLGFDVAQAYRNRQSLLNEIMDVAASDYAGVAPQWNQRVLMTDCEIVRVRFFAPGTRYAAYFAFLDDVGGFWRHRWGDHAVRALGAAFAIHVHNEQLGEIQPKAVPAVAYQMQIPFAHQATCFCMDTDTTCVQLGLEASAVPLWPAHKAVWTCQRKLSA